VVTDESENSGLRRVTRQGEEAIGKIAQELLGSSVVSGALSAAMQTRERAMHAQEAALSALNLPSASDLERLTRRIRSVSQRLEGIEDGLDRVERKLGRLEHQLDEQAAVVEERAAATTGESAG
jgi:septal ring factor EnvC (AmiA/AmiB activator)